jgi:hydrogenase maturation protease
MVFPERIPYSETWFLLMTQKVTLIGLGNILMRDEGVGVYAVRYLEEHYEIPPGLEVVDGGTSGLDLLPYIENRDRVLIVDAVDFRKEPGYIGVLGNQEVPALFGLKDSLHHLGLMDLLAAAQLLGVAPKTICLIGIQPLAIETGLDLTDVIQARLAPLAARILAQLQAWGLSLPSRVS